MLVWEGHKEDLQSHMYKLYQRGEMCDLEIYSRDGVSIRAHRLVLTASSRYLYNLFLQAADCSSLPLDIPSDVLHVLLEFCYTGKLFVTSDRRADRRADILEAAVYLQMYNVLELLNIQCIEGTSQSYHQLGNQSLISYDTSSKIQEHTQTSLGIVTKEEGQAGDLHNEKHSEDRNRPEIIIKQEESVLHYAENQQQKSANKVGTNLNGSHYKTRSRSKNTETKNLIENADKATHCYIDQVDEHRQSRSTALVTEITDRRNSVKVIDNDPDYKPETIVKVRKRNVVKTRSKAGDEKLENPNVFSKGNNGRIFITIKNSKIGQAFGRNRKRKRGYKVHKIFIPKSMKKVCPHCNKSFMSSVFLNRHQLCVHFTKNCTQLRRHHIVKLSKRLMDIRNNCSVNINTQCRNFECKLCNANFSKYSQFTMHHRRKHRNNVRSVESWLRYCSVKLAIQKLLVPFAKDRKSNSIDKSNFRQKNCREKTFKCTVCNKMLLTQHTLDVHKRNVHGEVSRREITRREKIVPPEPLFICLECRKSNNTLRALNHHLQLHHGYSSKEANKLQHHLPHYLGCEMCEFKTQDLQEMKDHVTEKHPSIKYQCTECSLSFKVQLLMKRHRFICHMIGKYNFRCQHCQKSFKKGSMLRKHEYFKHNVQHDNIKVFYCEHPGCNYKTYASTAIKMHQSKHVKEKRFPCEYCGVKLKTKMIRQKHIDKMHLGIRPFLCQVCGLSFGEKHELQSHITNKHSNERSYQCQLCSYGTAVKSTFFTHVFNVHKIRAEEDKRELFSCPHCPFTSILKYRYQTHVNGHTNTRNYECKICKKAFVSANTLRSHKQWVHSDTVYSCTQCDYQTKTRQKLNEHIRVQHQLQGFKPYKCPYCAFRCATGGNTRKHVKQVHKGEEVTYVRDDELLAAARMARASGHYASIFNTLSTVQLTHEVSEDEHSELSENILHIAL